MPLENALIVNVTFKISDELEHLNIAIERDTINILSNKDISRLKRFILERLCDIKNVKSTNIVIYGIRI